MLERENVSKNCNLDAKTLLNMIRKQRFFSTRKLCFPYFAFVSSNRKVRLLTVSAIFTYVETLDTLVFFRRINEAVDAVFSISSY